MFYLLIKFSGDIEKHPGQDVSLTLRKDDSLAKWLSARLRTKCLWIRVLLQSSKQSVLICHWNLNRICAYNNVKVALLWAFIFLKKCNVTSSSDDGNLEITTNNIITVDHSSTPTPPLTFSFTNVIPYHWKCLILITYNV